jgi:cardiolipin synthase
MHTPSAESTWQIYRSNKKVWEDMLETCRNAKTSIDFEQFIFVNDEIGKQFVEICTERAKAGVRVRFLFDDAGTFNRFIWDDAKTLSLANAFFFNDLSKRGIQVGSFNTIIPRSIDNHRWWFFRNHRRSLVVDSKIAFLSSHVLSVKTQDWHDASIRIESSSVITQIEQAFSALWARAHNIKVDWGKDNPTTHDGFSYATNAPVPKQRHAYFRLIEAIRGARSYVHITTPYFVPDRRLSRVLRLAVRRGVDVRIIVPESSNHRLVDIAGQASFAGFMKDGVKIYRHRGPLLHAKVAVVDGNWGSIGTMNLDYISLRYNFEANLIGTNKVFVSELQQYCREEISESVLLDPTIWEHRNPARKWLEFLVRFIRQAL